MNRYGVVRNVTPFELVHKKHYTGSIAQFAEPVFGYFRVGAKGRQSGAEPCFWGKWMAKIAFFFTLEAIWC